MSQCLDMTIYQIRVNLSVYESSSNHYLKTKEQLCDKLHQMIYHESDRESAIRQYEYSSDEWLDNVYYDTELHKALLDGDPHKLSLILHMIPFSRFKSTLILSAILQILDLDRLDPTEADSIFTHTVVTPNDIELMQILLDNVGYINAPIDFGRDKNVMSFVASLFAQYVCTDPECYIIAEIKYNRMYTYLKMLLEAGLNPNDPPAIVMISDQLRNASRQFRYDIIELLLEYGADPNTSEQYYGPTYYLLDSIIQLDDPDLLQLIINNGANIHNAIILSDSVRSGLDGAVRRKSPEMTEIIINAGATTSEIQEAYNLLQRIKAGEENYSQGVDTGVVRTVRRPGVQVDDPKEREITELLESYLFKRKIR